MAMYLKSPAPHKSHIANRDPSASPIASKQKTPSKPKHRKNLLSDFQHAANRTPSKQKRQISSLHKLEVTPSKIFSPKYLDSTPREHNDEILLRKSPLQSPPTSPQRQSQIDENCQHSVHSIRKSVWNAASDDLDALMFMKYAPSLPSTYFDDKPAALPLQKKRHRGRATLVLDLDETLVHCSIEKLPDADLVFPIKFNDASYQVYMKQRPQLQAFLEYVSGIFEVVVFTASQQCYADTLLDLLDPRKQWIHHRLFRQHCVNVEGNYVKDLRVLGRDLTRTMIIDNSPPAFTYQINNGIPIVSWYDDREDTHLLQMTHVLHKLAMLQDVRPAIKKYFKMKRLLKSLPI